MSRITAGVLTISDKCSRREREDLSGTIIYDHLEDGGYDIQKREIVPDDAAIISERLLKWCSDVNLIITTGGTGFSPRDVTPEATSTVIDRPAPGVAEMLRWTGYQRNPRAILSRGVAGMKNQTLIINLPGSPKAVTEGLEVLLPMLPHALELMLGTSSDH